MTDEVHRTPSPRPQLPRCYKRRLVTGADADDLVALFDRAFLLLPDTDLCGHYPNYGVRYFDSDELTLETTICLSCANWIGVTPRGGERFRVSPEAFPDLASSLQSHLPLSPHEVGLARNEAENLGSPEVDRVYFFVRIAGSYQQLVRFLRHTDGSAALSGALKFSYEGHPQAWREALDRLHRKRFVFHSAGPVLHMSDFPSDDDDPLSGPRRWAHAINEARPAMYTGSKNPSPNAALQGTGLRLSLSLGSLGEAEPL